MNGTIDFSNGHHGNPDKHLQDDDPLEDWDESSCSDSCSSCSCSSCSTCSCCDLCDDYDDVDDINDTVNEYASNGLPFAGGINQKHRNDDVFASMASSKNRKGLGYQHNQPRTTQDSLDVRRKVRALTLENNVDNQVHPRYNYAHMRNHSSSTKHFKQPCSTQEAYDDESGISMYSSGSDKETLSSTNSKHCRASHPRLEDRIVTTSHTQKPQQRSNQKKVTFEESAFNTEGFAMESKHHCLSKQKRCKNKETSSNPNIDMEYKRLESILEHIDPFKLHSIMKHQLRKKHTQSILALGRLLPKKQFSGETKHCVRCHKQYDPQYGINDCYLEHRKNKLIIQPQRDNTACVRCTVCTKEYWVQQQKDFSTINLGHCFVGKHTSSPEETKYYPHGAARTCEDRGCIEFYV